MSNVASKEASPASPPNTEVEQAVQDVEDAVVEALSEDTKAQKIAKVTLSLLEALAHIWVCCRKKKE